MAADSRNDPMAQMTLLEESKPKGHHEQPREVPRLSVLAVKNDTPACGCCDNNIFTLEFQAKCCLFWALFFSLLAAIFLALGLSYIDNKNSFNRFKETTCTLDGDCIVAQAPILWSCSHSRWGSPGEECFKWNITGLFNSSQCTDSLCRYFEDSCAHAEEGPTSWTTAEQAKTNCLAIKNLTHNKRCWYDSSLQIYHTKCEADYSLPGIVYGPAWPRQWAYNLVVVGCIIAGVAVLLFLGGVGRMIQRCCQYGKKRRQQHRHHQYR